MRYEVEVTGELSGWFDQLATTFGDVRERLSPERHEWIGTRTQELLGVRPLQELR